MIDMSIACLKHVSGHAAVPTQPRSRRPDTITNGSRGSLVVVVAVATLAAMATGACPQGIL